MRNARFRPMSKTGLSRSIETLESRLLLTLDLTSFPLPRTITAQISTMTIGPDGNVWFGEYGTGKIGEITLDGTITEFPVPSGQGTNIEGITTGPDGGLWFTESPEFGTAEPAKIGHLPFTKDAKTGISAISGPITEFDVPSLFQYGLGSITAGPNGDLWFIDGYQERIGQITTAGVFSVVDLPGNGAVDNLAAGADGNVWTNQGTEVDKVTPAGVLTPFPIPIPDSDPFGNQTTTQPITSGPDGNLWFAVQAGATIEVGRVTPAGVITEYPIALPPGTEYIQSLTITTNPDGNLLVSTTYPTGLWKVMSRPVSA